MEGNYIPYYDSILNHISRYQDNCYNCANYRHGLCGFVYPAQRFVGGATILLETYKEMDYDERLLYDTRASGDPCENQEGSVSFLNEIEESLEKLPQGADEGTLTHVLRRLYRLLGKHNITDPLMANTSIRSDVLKATQLILAKLDLDALENNVSILPMIKTTKLGYTRKGGLYLICPEELAIPLIKKSIVQTPNGYYLGKGVYANQTEDVIIDSEHFLAKERSQALSLYKRKMEEDSTTVSIVDDEKEFPRGKDALNKCLSLITSSDALLFLQAFDLCFGIRFQAPYVVFDTSFHDSFIKQYLAPKHCYIIDYYEEITSALAEEIRLRKDDEHALAVYISGLLSGLSGISRMIFPQDGTRVAKAMPELYRLTYIYADTPDLDYTELVEEAFERVDKTLERGTPEFDQVFNEARSEMSYMKDIGKKELLTAGDIIEALVNIEASLEGALLINGIKHDYLYYESLCNIRLIGDVDAFSVASVTEMTVTAIRRFATDLNHQCLLKDDVDVFAEEDSNSDVQPVTNLPLPVIKNPDLKKYLDALREDNYLDASYHWIRKGHTNYHAGWAAKIMLANVEGLRYEEISKIIGVSNLADHASKCLTHNKTSKQQDIEFCFSSHNLSTTRS